MLPFLIAAYLNRPELLVCCVVREAERQGLDPIVVCALVEVESGWRIHSKSETNDFGLMQINMAYHGIYHDTREHIRKGCAILRDCIDRRSGNLFQGLSLYNTGRVSKRGLRYARKVLSLSARIKEAVTKGKPVPHHYPFRVAQKDRLYPLSWLEWAPKKRLTFSGGRGNIGYAV